jgi:hypothetical protein
MSKAKETLSRWLASRKFFLLCVAWFIILVGGIIMFYQSNEFEQKREVFNDCIEWLFYFFAAFAGIEGGKELVAGMRGRQPRVPSDPINTDIA